MKFPATCLFAILCATPALADDISADNRGTWTTSGTCTDTRRILIGADTVTLVDTGRKLVLKEGDESVWNGMRMINATRAAKDDKTGAIAFSGQIVEREGQTLLQTKDLGEAEKAFEGEYKRCRAETQSAQVKPKQNVRRATNERSMPRMTRPASPWPNTLLGGLY